MMPGNVVHNVPDAQDTVIKINATGMSVFGIVSLLFYKLFCGQRNETDQQNDE